MNFSDRLRVIIGDRKLADVGVRWGVDASTIRGWLYSDNYPRVRTMIDICKSENVSADWLMLGRPEGAEVKIPRYEVTTALRLVGKYEPINEEEKIKKKAYMDAFRYVLKIDREDTDETD